jgi:hypothetical protein
MPAESKRSKQAFPERPFFANDLPPKDYKIARRAWEEAGVKITRLLDACTLDVAVIGSQSAAKVYAGTPKPGAVGDANGKHRRYRDHYGD